MAYRLNCYRTNWAAMRELEDGWYGGPEILVKGTISERYGYPGSFGVTGAMQLIQRVQDAMVDPRPVSLGEPFRRHDVPGGLDSGAWVRALSTHDDLYVDADLITLAEKASGLTEWRYIALDKLDFPVLVQSNGTGLAVAVVAPCRPDYKLKRLP